MPDERARRHDTPGATQHRSAARGFSGTERIDVAAFQKPGHRLRQRFDDFHVTAKQHTAASEQITQGIKGRRGDILNREDGRIFTRGPACGADAGHRTAESRRVR